MKHEVGADEVLRARELLDKADVPSFNRKVAYYDAEKDEVVVVSLEEYSKRILLNNL